MPANQATKANLSEMGEHVLLVEGIDDWHSIGKLLQVTTGGLPKYEIAYCENDAGVLDRLAGITEASMRSQSILGAVVDADIGDSEVPDDSGVKARLRSLRGRLGKYYDIPDIFPINGLILTPKDASEVLRLPVLGIWLMPDNTRDGIFEDLLRAGMAPACEGYICTVVDKAKSDQIATFRDVERSKAVVKTHIAWQDPNKKHIGEALGSHFENLSAATRPFIGWLNRLFQTEMSS